MAIWLDSVGQIPRIMLDEFRRLDRLFASCRSIDQLLQDPSLQRLAADLDELCLAEGVVGYHYTRALREQIAGQGLRLSCGADRRREFMSEYGHRFSEEQRGRIRQRWNDHFDEAQNRGRDGRIWFNCTLGSLEDDGAGRLLTFFGGESIYMPLTEDDDVAAVLRTIGQPLIIEARLPGTKLHTFRETPWGRIWLSTYHVSVNKEAKQDDVDAYVLEPVPPDNIVSINNAAGWR